MIPDAPIQNESTLGNRPENAEEVAKDLSKRGIEMETNLMVRDTPDTGAAERLQRAWPWKRVGNQMDTATQAKQKLQEYRRKQPTWVYGCI